MTEIRLQAPSIMLQAETLSMLSTKAYEPYRRNLRQLLLAPDEGFTHHNAVVPAPSRRPGQICS